MILLSDGEDTGMDCWLSSFRWTCGKRNHPAVAFQRRPVHDGLFRYTKYIDILLGM